MWKIFEGKKEPLFGRATAKLYVEPLEPYAVSKILADYKLDSAGHLPFYYTLFGGIPKYCFFESRRGDAEIDVVALDEDGGNILFGECKLKGEKFSKG